MTVIACTRDAMGADSQMTCDGLISQTTKLFRLPDKSIVGIYGNMAQAFDLVRWITGDLVNPPERIEEAGMLCLKPNGEILEWDGHIRPINHTSEFVAAGSGAALALGALEAGATLKKALEIAVKRDAHSCAPIVIMRLAVPGKKDSPTVGHGTARHGSARRNKKKLES